MLRPIALWELSVRGRHTGKTVDSGKSQDSFAENALGHLQLRWVREVQRGSENWGRQREIQNKTIRCRNGIKPALRPDLAPDHPGA